MGSGTPFSKLMDSQKPMKPNPNRAPLCHSRIISIHTEKKNGIASCYLIVLKIMKKLLKVKFYFECPTLMPFVCKCRPGKTSEFSQVGTYSRGIGTGGAIALPIFVS